MPVPHQDEVSIRYTLSLEDGTQVGGQIGGDVFNYTPGHEQIMPVLEEAMLGVAKGGRKQIILAPEHGRSLKLDVARLAHTLGHPGETLVLDIEIL